MRIETTRDDRGREYLDQREEEPLAADHTVDAAAEGPQLDLTLDSTDAYPAIC